MSQRRPTRSDACGQIGTESAQIGHRHVRPARGIVAGEGGGTAHPTLGGGCGGMAGAAAAGFVRRGIER